MTKDHKWLRHAARDFEHEMARQAGSLPSLTDRAKTLRRSTAEQMSRWQGPVSLLAFIAGLHGLVLAPSPGFLPAPSDTIEFLATLWQVTAALIGIAFAIFVLLMESMRSSTRDDYVWSQFQIESLLYPSISIFVGTITATGIGYLAMLPSQGLPTPRGLSNLLIVDLFLFAASVLALLWLYRTVILFMRPGYVEEFVARCADRIVERTMRDAVRTRISDRILSTDCTNAGMAFYRGTSSWPGWVPEFLSQPGRVSDINRHALKELGNMLPAANPHKAVMTLGVGSTCTVVPQTTAIFVPKTSRAIHGLLQRCYKLSK